MSYEKQVWSKYDALKSEEENIENGAVVTDSRMNHMENGISDSSSTVENHIANKLNPHSVTKNQVGLGNVDNIEQAAKIDFDSHVSNKNNPHSVTASQTGAYTKAEVANLISEAIKQSKLDANPIGTILTAISGTNPSTYIGGTWERFAQGRTLVGVDESDSVQLMKTSNKNGGSTNPLTEHNHQLRMLQNGASAQTAATGTKYGLKFSEDNYWRIGDLAICDETNNSGPSGQTGGIAKTKGNNADHANWQPFVTVYFWKRTA